MRESPSKLALIIRELKAHLPYTALGTLAGIGLLSIIRYAFVDRAGLDPNTTLQSLFHLFHFGHVYLSAMSTTAIFYRHENNLVKACWVGLWATLLFCGLSDFLIPYIGGWVLGVPMTMHLCLFEEPIPVLLFNSLGILTGLVVVSKLKRISYFSHGAHVCISGFASLFYLVSYGVDDWYRFILGLFVISTVAVVIPCCSSDIIMPLSFVSGAHGHEHEDEHTQGHHH
ncbi:MAG: hypothetical protein Q8R76_12060 [Candidatus Omnitrophota bacterium]|nr:hypothetical protein [Candidatus Omnitrophota bacterium]